MDRLIRLVMWNANGVAHKRNELRHFVSEIQLDVMFMMETRLADNTNFTFPAFQAYRTNP